jgi:tetratricopeptide (TPR) repeat protein
MRAHYLESVGRYDDAATLLAELEQRCAGDRSRQRAAVLVNQARLLTIKGLDEETLEPLQEAISILDELKRWDALARALNNRGIALANLGRHCEAQSTYERALEIHEQIGDAVGASSLRTNLGQIKMEDGRIDEALALFEQSISLKRTANDRYGLSIALYSRAIARRQLGDETACDRDLREALEIAEAIGERSIIDEVKRLMQS